MPTSLTILITLFSVLFLLAFLSIVFYTIRNGISPMPSTTKASLAILNLVPENSTGTISELGSGWGTLAFPLAKKFPNCHIIAYENSPIPYLFSKIRLLFQPRPNLTFKFQDFFNVPLDHTQIVICYLYPGAMRLLKMKFENELPKDSFVISNTFAIPGWQPIQTEKINDLYHNQIYLYQT